MNRRQLLAAMGLGAGSLVLPSARPRAGAKSPETPQRLVIFFTQHGTWHPGWQMGSGPSDQDWSLSLSDLSTDDFSDALLPLHSYRDRLLLLDGLALVSAEADLSGLRHEVGQVHALTGANARLVSGVPLASSASVDQVIANHIGRSDRYRSLELAVGSPPMSVTYSGDKQLLPYESNIARSYNRLFGLNTGNSDVLRKEQSSVLDLVADRHKALAGRLGTEDNQKLETHRELVRELEQRIAGLTDLSCQGPSPVPVGNEDYQQTAQATAQLIASALSCDLTRVVTLQMGELPMDLVNPGYVGSLHDEFAHAVYTDPYAAQIMTDYTTIHAQQFANLLDQLDSIPESGGTVLDNTLCVWVGELGDGTHGYNQWNVVMAGGQSFEMGRYLHFKQDSPLEAWTWDGTQSMMGRPHQHLLVSLLQAFGLDVNQLGVSSVQGSQGELIDCTGGLL